MKKTYFIRTFNIIQNLFIMFVLEAFLNFSLIFLSIAFENSATTIPLLLQLKKLIDYLSSCLNIAELITAILIAVLLAFEIIARVKDDSLLNIFKSIWQTLRLRHFMAQTERTEKTVEMQKVQSVNLIYANFNKAVHRCVIDVSEDKIIIFIKVPSSQQAQKILREMESQIREEVSSRNPNFYFSAPDRIKNSMWFTGTKR